MSADNKEQKTSADFDLAHAMFSNVVNMLSELRIDPACVLPAMAATMTGVLSVMFKPEGIDGLVDKMAETIKKQAHERIAARNSAGVNGASASAE